MLQTKRYSCCQTKRTRYSCCQTYLSCLSPAKSGCCHLFFCVTTWGRKKELNIRILQEFHHLRQKKRVKYQDFARISYLKVMISAASSSSSFPLCTRWMSKERLPERPGTASLVYVFVDILGEDPRCTSRPFATYWKMLFVTVPLESSMNMPMLMRMQWKRFFSTLREAQEVCLRKSKLNLWMCPCPADEANETSLHVVAGDGRRGSVLKQEHQVAVVEVVPLQHIEFSSFLGVVKR